MKTDLVEQKSMLAKLMAAENISVEHKKIPTAAFDVKNRVLYLPILKWKPGSNVYDLFCAHEVGHALWTPYEGWHSSVSEKGKGYKSFLNVIEDARIEKKIKRKFAGARKCMSSGYNELMDEDFFGLRKMGVIPNDLGLIDRINLYTKAGTDYGVEFSDEEREWVEKVERTETWEDVVEVTDALYEWCKENESETDNSYGDFGDDDFDEDEDGEREEESEGSEGSEDDVNEENDFRDDSKEKRGEGEESTEEETSSNSSGNSENDSEEDSEEESENSSNNFEGGESDPYGDRGFSDYEEENDPTSLTDEAFRAKEEELADMSDGVRIPKYLTFPKINTESIVIDYKIIHEELNKYYNSQDGAVDFGNKLLREFKTSNSKMISYMVKEFEMRKAADIHRRAYASKKGNLDMNKIHAYKYSENLFRQITNLPEGKNHGMVMFIDWSGSMHGYMKDTIEQLINLTMFCQKVQIPFEVYAFSDHYRDYSGERDIWNEKSRSEYDTTLAGKKVANYKKNELIISNNLRLMTLFSSKMRNPELNQAYKNLLLVANTFSNYYGYRSYDTPYFGAPSNFSLGGTPLDATIICAKTIIEEFKTRTKAQIVNAVFLTDGQSNRNNHYLDSENVSRQIDRENLHIDDSETRTRTYPKRENGRQMDTTSIFLSALKKSLGINLLGFFLTSGTGRRTAGDMSYIMERYPKDEEISKFRKEKFLIETKTSYDELYIINTKGLEIDEVDHMDNIEVGSTKAVIRRALKKNTNGKLQNRMLLNAFIKKVA
tara:strand:- start:5799 stop:8120 length:2322 start_codon:yes stop_codon:yes gene_type:complete